MICFSSSTEQSCISHMGYLSSFHSTVIDSSSIFYKIETGFNFALTTPVVTTVLMIILRLRSVKNLKRAFFLAGVRYCSNKPRCCDKNILIVRMFFITRKDPVSLRAKGKAKSASNLSPIPRCNHTHCLFSYLATTYLITRCNHSHCPFSSLIASYPLKPASLLV